MPANRRLKTKTRRTPWRALLAFICLFLPHSVFAAEAIPPLVATIATTTLDPGGRPWAYLVFEANKPGILAGKSFGIYLKSGTPDAATNFAFRGLAAATKDPTAIQVLLSRALNIGDNTVALDAEVLGLHRLLINNFDSSSTNVTEPPPMPLYQRLAAVLNRADGDTALAGMLDLLGFAHPAVRLARGTAWAGPLGVAVGADVTLEVRERTASGADGAVMARVSLKAGQPAVLPAPGPVVVVPDASANGDLAAELRWATPDALRQAGSRHHGDVLWRVSRAFAEAQGFDGTPPTGAALDALATSNNANVKRVGGPIFPQKLFSAADVADFTADATTTYLADNNDRFAAGGVALPEGSQFYYFVAAADALGRPGPAGAGVLATFCKRVPPLVPSGLAVGNVWDGPTNQQFLDVKWMTNPAGDGTGTTRYEVYRGDDLAAHAAAQQGLLDLNANPIDPAHPDSIKRIAVVVDPGALAQTLLHVSDDGADASGTPVPGKPWWFAVRAVHAAPPGCGDVASALGPPVFGGLRYRIAPPAPDANSVTTDVDCLRVACINDVPPADTVSTDALDATVLNFTAQCQRRNAGISAVHFYVTVGLQVIVPETVVVFPEDVDPALGGNVVSFSWTAPLSMLGSTFRVQCRAESPGGVLSSSPTSIGNAVDPTGNHFMLHHFMAGAISEAERLDAAHANDPLWSSLGAPPPDWPQDLHLAYSPDSGAVKAPHFSLTFPPHAEQYRVYRRIDDGPLTLIKQGLRGIAVNLDFFDEAPPHWNAQVHYFTQMLDENGRGSAMLKLKSLRFTGDTPPTPVLLTPKPADFGGDHTAPTLTLSWLCAPEHVDRFEVFFKTENLPAPAGTSTSGISALGNLSRRAAMTPIVHTTVNKFDNTLRLAVIDESFLTGRVGSGIGPGPKFSVTLNLNPNLKYTVWLRALGPNGEAGLASRSIDFKWQAPTAPPANIAWPARPLPSVAAFNSGITAVDFRTVDAASLVWTNSNGPVNSVAVDQTPIGIRIGLVTITGTAHFTAGLNGMAFGLSGVSNGPGLADPNAQLYASAADRAQKLLPCVLYRQQVENPAFPAVSGAVIQASPLISKIANRPYAEDIFRGAELVDPYFRWVRTNVANNTNTIALYLVDTQPVVTGARYRYWLTRFNAFNEPVQTIPCGEVTVAANNDNL